MLPPQTTAVILITIYSSFNHYILQFPPSPIWASSNTHGSSLRCTPSPPLAYVAIVWWFTHKTSTVLWLAAEPYDPACTSNQITSSVPLLYCTSTMCQCDKTVANPPQQMTNGEREMELSGAICWCYIESMTKFLIKISLFLNITTDLSKYQ